MEGQHPAQDEEMVQAREREGGVEGMLGWERGGGRREEEQELVAEEDEMLRMRRAMVVREQELQRIQEAGRLHLPDEVEEEEVGGIQVRIQVARQEGMLPAIPAQQVAGEVMEDPRVRLGHVRAELHQAGAGLQRQPLGIQVRIQNAGAGVDGIQAPEAPQVRVEVAGGVGADAEVANAGGIVGPALEAPPAVGVAGFHQLAHQLAHQRAHLHAQDEVNRRGNPGDDAAAAADLQEERRERRLRMMRWIHYCNLLELVSFV